MFTENNNNNFMVGDISVSPQHNLMTNGDHHCRLQPKVMAVLLYLAKNNDRVINNDELFEHVWQGRVVTSSSIQKCVNSLRSAFTELDDSFEYVVYFSKRGYQLVSPATGQAPNAVTSHNERRTSLAAVSVFTILIIVTVVVAASLSYLAYSPFNDDSKTLSEPVELNQFTQVKPFVSNTGREKLIEPHATSERVAFILDEFVSGGERESQLFIKGTRGQQWPVSVARGEFVGLAWSPSGRNLVAIDRHDTTESENTTERENIPDNERTIDNENGSDSKRLSGEGGQQHSPDYYTLHIFTLDFKAEKIIEKNLLSHWLGNISSVAWWDEGSLELIASQGGQRARYRYGIADQNLSLLQASVGEGELLMSHILNKQSAILSLRVTGEQIQFLDETQKVIGERSIPFKVISMSWISNGSGVLLLAEDNQLSILHTDGRLRSVEYTPQINGRITHARSKDEGRKIVLTVEVSSLKDTTLFSRLMNNEDAANHVQLSQARFMENGGGFIYRKPRNE